MSDFQTELKRMIQSGWEQQSEWNGITPGNEFFAVVGGFRPPSSFDTHRLHTTPALQRFICGAILHKPPGHGKFVDGAWIPLGNGRTWIMRLTANGEYQGGMTASLGMHASVEAALIEVEEMRSQRIMKLREEAAKLSSLATELEGKSPPIEILDFTVDLGDSPR